MNEALHKKHLIDILIAIYKDPFLAHNLYFKGGTAFFLFHELPRFSTDLDFDVANTCKDHQKIFETAKNIIKKFGTIKDERIKKNTIFFVLSLRAQSASAQRGEESGSAGSEPSEPINKHQERLIKIEISARDFGLESFEIKNIFGIDVKLLSLDFLCAHKLVALTERTKARDLFDAYFILLNDLPINEDIIMKRTNLSLKDFFKKVAKKIEQDFSRKNILFELGGVVEPNKKIWIREKLKPAVLELIQKRI